MSRKSLSDFKYDYQAYADYLESAECANDDGYDIYADEKGNIYERTDGDWTKGHGHKNESTKYDRKPDDDSSKGRPWKNPWLTYVESLKISPTEKELLISFFGVELFNQSNECENNLIEKNKILTKRK